MLINSPMSKSNNTKYKLSPSTLLQLGETPNSIYISASTSTSVIDQDVTVTVTVYDNNTVGISGLTVELSNTTSTMTDNNDGTYTFLVTSDVNNLITYTATIVDSDLTTDINVQYVGPATSISILTSAETALSNQNVTITPNLVDSNNNGVPGESITITGDDGSSWPGTDDGNGNYTSLVSSLDPMTVIYTGTDGELSSNTVSVLYIGPTSSVTLTTSTSVSIINQLVTLTFTAMDSNNNGVYGDTVNITGDDGSSYIMNDNNDGTYTYDITSSVATTVNYTGDDTTVGISSDPVQVVYNLPNMILLLKASDYSGSGTWNDQSTFGNNATIENGNISVNSAGNGIILDGSTSWTFPNVMAGSYWSANVWFKRTGSQTGPQACILTQITDDSSVNLTIGDINQNNNNTFSSGFMSDSVYETDNLEYSLTPLNLWINIQVTWDGTNLITYINGVQYNSTQIGGKGTFFSASDSGLAYRIGNSWDSTNTSDYMIGEIGEVRIYNYAINSTEVLNDYNESLPTYYNISTFIPSGKYFNTCTGIVNDSIGNLYVAVYDDNKIYKINQSGYGIIFADFTLYDIYALHGMTIDPTNNIYICAANGNIYKVDIFGNIFIFNQGISFINPWSICNDGSGNFYVTDYAAGTITHLYNDGNNNATVTESLNNPQSIIILNGILYFVNHEDGTVMSCYTDGSGLTTVATLTSPTALCGDQFGNLVVVDSDNTIYGINITTNDISTLSSSSSINNPLGIIRNSLNNNFYISNSGNGSILKLSLGDSGIITYVYTAPGANSVQTCVTDSSGNLYTSYYNGTVYQNSDLIANIGVTTIGCITIDFDGNLYVSGGRIIYQIASGSWEVTTYYTNSNTNTNYIGILWTQSGIYVTELSANNIRLIDNSLNETVIASGFNQPRDIKIGPNGNIYVSNFGNGIISLINATTFIVTTFKSGFSSCVGIVFDCYGNLFMSDKTANNLYAIDQSGNNTLIASSLGSPNGIYYYNNTVYVCNNSNNKIATFSNYITPIPSIATRYFNNDGYGVSNGITSQPNGALNVMNSNYHVRKIDTNLVSSYLIDISSSYGICTDINGNIYVGAYDNIYIYNPYTNTNNVYASGFSTVRGIAITIDMTIMYVVDNGSNSLIKVTDNGTILNTVFSDLNNPNDVKLDSNNFIYIADNGNARILKINPDDYSYIIIGTNLIYTSPQSITFYNNNLIMNDSSTNNLYSIDSSGFSRLIMSNYSGYSGYLTTDYKKNIFLSNLNDSSIIEIPNIVSQTNQLVVLLEAHTYTNNYILMDQSGNNNNSALNTGTIALNEIGNGIILDGSSSLILNDLHLGNTWSIGIWYKDNGTDFTGDIPIITQQSNNNINNTANAFIGGYNGNLTSGFVNNNNYKVSTHNITLTIGQWTNIQVTWNGTNLITYVNNILLGSTVLDSFSSSSGFSYIIGSDNYGNYVNGEIGEFRAYNYALTAQQVATNYNTTYMTYLKTPFTILINTPITFNQFAFSISEQQNSEIIVPILKTGYNSRDSSKIIKSDINLDNNPIYTGTFISVDNNIIPGIKSVEFLGDLVLNTNTCSITLVFSIGSDNINKRIASFYNAGLNDHDNNNSIGIGYNDGNICLYYNNSTSTLITVNTDTFYILSYIIDDISGNLYTYLNGVLMATDNLNININTSLLDISSELSVVLYPYTLRNENRQKLEGYLAWKWKINSSLSSEHPYYNTPPIISNHLTKNEPLFTLKLSGWTSNVNITTLYLFDTTSGTFLTNITKFHGNNTTGYYATFSYQFKQAQNYVTICTTNNLSTGISYVIAEPLIITPPLVLTLSSNDSLNNWGYYNIPIVKSFLLSSYYYDNLVNYLDYYSTMKVYYADNNTFDNLNLIGNAVLTNNSGIITVSFSFTYNPDLINTPTLYFYFGYSNNPSSTNTFVTNEYIFFDKTSLNFSLDHYNYYNNYTLCTNFPNNMSLKGNNALYVYYSKDDPTYSNQKYITNIQEYSLNNGCFKINFPLPDKGNYYLTISNRGPNIVRTSHDINVNIESPIYVNLVNVSLNHYFGYYQNINNYIGYIGTYNGNSYPFSTIRVFYSNIIATQNSDLTELANSPLTITNNEINFDFENLVLSPIYYYFTANTDQIPPMDSFTRTPIINIYDKKTITFTLDHYDNSSPNYILTCLNWDSTLNTMSPLNLYILDSNKIDTGNQPIQISISNNENIWSGSFTFDFNNLDSGSYYIAVTDNYIIPTPIIVNLAEPHFILLNNQNTSIGNSYRISQPKPPIFFTPTQPLTLSSPVYPTYSSNQIITLVLSKYYPKIYLYYGPTSTSFSNLSVINNLVTGNNIYTVNKSNNSITFNIDHSTSTDNIIYFYASTCPNYTGVSGISLPFSYIDSSKINVSLNHYNIDTNIYNVNITGYNSLLINQPLNVLAIQNNSKYINTGQTLSLSSVNNSTSNYTSQFTFSFPLYNIFNIVLCNSFDMTNQPNGNIYYQISKNIYSFTLTASLSDSDIYPGLNSKTLNFTIPGLPSNLCVANLIPNGNILLNNQLILNKTIILNQMNIDIYKYQNNGFTIWLDAMDLSTITFDSNNNISEWNDKSGLTRNCTQTQSNYKPLYDSTNNGILFRGDTSNQEFLNLPFTTFNNTNYYTCSFVFTHNGNDTFLMSKQHTLGLFYNNGQSFRWQPAVGVILDTYFGDFKSGIKYQMTFTYDGYNYRLWRNGQLHNTVSIQDGAIPDNLNVTTCTLGSWQSPEVGNNNVNIEIHEFIFNESYLYDDEIQKIESYLCNKWSITNTSINPHLNNIIIFTPNTTTYSNIITFNTTDDVISIPNTFTNVLVNPILTLNSSISTYYIITLDNWNSDITKIYLYGGTNSSYYNRSMLAELSVTNDSNGYYIIVTIDPLPDNNYYSIRDVNSDIFNFDLRVSDPNYSLKLKRMNNNIETSPSTCALNTNNTIILTFPEHITNKLYVYTCQTLYTTGNVGSGDRDLTFINIIDSSNIKNNEAEIIINPTKLPIYILISTENNYNGIYYQSNLITEQNKLILNKITKLNGRIDQINTFTIQSNPLYKNIQINDLTNIIDHKINKNSIEFSYDPGFELNTTFNIINSKSKEIYDVIEVTFIDPINN